MSHPDFRTRVHSERPGWYVPYARGGEDTVQFANDRLNIGSPPNNPNKFEATQKTSISDYPNHPLSRQEARLQLRRAGKGSERSPTERRNQDHQNKDTLRYPEKEGPQKETAIPDAGLLNQAANQSALPKQTAAASGPEPTNNQGLTVDPAKTAEEEWSWPIGASLTEKQQCQLTELLDSFKDIFAFNMKEMTTIPGVEFEIPVSDETPVFKHQYRLAQTEKEDLAQQVAERL